MVVGFVEPGTRNCLADQSQLQFTKPDYSQNHQGQKCKEKSMLLEAETGQCVCERRTSNELTKSDKTN
jgi:hypothetical protein